MARSTWQPVLIPHEALGPQLHAAVVADIRSGRLAPDHRLPGSRDLARRLGIARATVVRVTDALAAEGWLVARPGSGMVVAPDLPPEVQGPTGDVAARCGFPLPAAPPAPRRLHAPPGTDFALVGGTPDLRLLPLTELARAYGRVLRGRGRQLVAYGDPQGELRLRQALAAWLARTRGLVARPEQLLLTRGSQMALHLLAQVLLRPGDRVAVEELGYPPAWAALEAAGATLLPVPVDGEGLVVDALPAAPPAAAPLRMVYLTPHHQYPTGAVLSAPRRLQLLARARREGIVLVEDDYDHEYHYEGRPVSPLAAADGQGLVAYVGTLSKAFAPGLRLGWVVAPEPLITRLCAARARVDRQGDRVVEQAVAELLEDGSIDRHLGRTRRAWRSRRDALLALVARHLPALRAEVPAGGLAVCFHAPSEVDLDAWAARCEAAGVFFSTGSAFAFDGSPRPWVRLGFAGQDEAELAEAVRRMAAAWQAGPPPQRRDLSLPGGGA